MEELLVYKAIENYTPSDDFTDTYIPIRAGDVLEVKMPTDLSTFDGDIKEPTGWLEGRNRNTNNTGLFPGTFVKYVKTSLRPIIAPRTSRQPHQAKVPLGEKTDNNDSGFDSPSQGLYGKSFDDSLLYALTQKVNIHAGTWLGVEKCPFSVWK